MLPAQLGDLAVGEFVDVAARHPDVAPFGAFLAVHQPQEGRLARSRGSDEEHELALGDLEPL